MGIFGKSAFEKVMDKARKDYQERNASNLESVRNSMEDYLKENESDLEIVKNNEISIKLNSIKNIVNKAIKKKYTVEKLIKRLNEKL